MIRVDANSNIEGIHEVNIKKNLTVPERDLKDGDKINEDRVEISETASKYNELSAAKDKIVKEVEASTSPDKLRSLKAQIESGTYHVSSEDIAGAILGLSGKNEAND